MSTESYLWVIILMLMGIILLQHWNLRQIQGFLSSAGDIHARLCEAQIDTEESEYSPHNAACRQCAREIRDMEYKIKRMTKHGQ